MGVPYNLILAKGYIPIILLFTITGFEMYHFKDYIKANVRMGTITNILAFYLPFITTTGINKR